MSDLYTCRRRRARLRAVGALVKLRIGELELVHLVEERSSSALSLVLGRAGGLVFVVRFDAAVPIVDVQDVQRQRRTILIVVIVVCVIVAIAAATAAADQSCRRNRQSQSLNEVFRG